MSNQGVQIWIRVKLGWIYYNPDPFCMTRSTIFEQLHIHGTSSTTKLRGWPGILHINEWHQRAWTCNFLDKMNVSWFVISIYISPAITILNINNITNIKHKKHWSFLFTKWKPIKIWKINKKNNKQKYFILLEVLLFTKPKNHMSNQGVQTWICVKLRLDFL